MTEKAKATIYRDTKTTVALKIPDGTKVKQLPFSYDSALELRNYCKDNRLRFEIEPRLKEWLKEQVAQRNSAAPAEGETSSEEVDLAKAEEDPWYFEMIPKDTELGNALAHRSFQREGVEFAVKHKEIVIADEPGLGKTIQALSAVIESNCTGSILVVAPKTAVYVTWPHELQRWLSEVAPYDEWVILGGKMTKLERIRTLKQILRWDMGKGRIGPRQWVIVSPNYLRLKPKVDWRGRYVYDEEGNKIIKPVREAQPALLAIDWAAIIVDEAHQTLSGAAGEPKNQSAQRQGLGLLEVKDNGMRIALTGTPFRGKHENLWGILNWLRPKDYTTYWGWVNRYFYVYQDYAGARVVGGLRDEEQFARNTKDLLLRRTKQEVAPELPRKLYGGTPLFPKKTGHDKGPIAVWLEMYGPQKKSYEQMAQQAMAELEGGTLMANGVLAEMVRLKQFANSHGFIGGMDEFFPNFPSNKFDWIIDFLEDRGIDGKGPGESKVLIASQFTKHIDLFAKQLREKHSIPCFVLTGKTNETERVNLQRDFQRGRLESGEPAPDVFLLNTKAGGTSITLDAADDVVVIDSTFNAEDQEQVEDRAHRISRVHNVTVWSLASTKSIDESILKNCYKMETSIKKILDGDRGVDFAKLLLGDAL